MRRVTHTAYPLVEAVQEVGPEQPQTASFLHQRYFEFERRLAYPQSRDPADWQQWRRRLRQALRRTLCLDQLGGVPTPQPRVLKTEGGDGYQRLKLAYETLPGNWVSAYLLVGLGEDTVTLLDPHVTAAKDARRTMPARWFWAQPLWMVLSCSACDTK